MPNLYADTGALRVAVGLGGPFRLEDEARAILALNAASRAIDGSTRRRFYAERRSVLATATTSSYVDLDRDVLSVESIAVLDALGNVVETIPGDDVRLLNWDEDGPPYHVLHVPDHTLPLGRMRVSVTGRFGYSDTTTPVTDEHGEPVEAEIDGNLLTVDPEPLFPITAGGTYRVGEQDVYVRAETEDGFVIGRGVNGTAVAGGIDLPIEKYAYEPDIVSATLLQAARLWKRKDIPILPVMSAPGVGTAMLADMLDPDVEAMIARLRRYL